MRFEYHPSTVSDLNRAVDFYDSRRVGLGAMSALRYTAQSIAYGPLRYGIEQLLEICEGASFGDFHSQSCIGSKIANRSGS